MFATGALLGILAFPCTASATATFNIVNRDSAGEGLNDPTVVAPVGGNTATTLGGQRLQALQYAAGLWGARLTSSVTTDIDVSFDPMDCGGTMMWSSWWDRDFANAPITYTWYPMALANKLAGSDLCVVSDCGTGSEFDMYANSSLDDGSCPAGNAWYYGLDGNPPYDRRDLVTFALLVIAKNLGVESTIDLATGALMDHSQDVLSTHLASLGEGKKLVSIDFDSRRLAALKDPGRLHWMGRGQFVSYFLPEADSELSAGLGPWGTVEMYTPDPPVPGLSVSMFSPEVSPDQLLEAPEAGLVGVARHDFGLADDALADLGWAVCGNGVVEMDEECDQATPWCSASGWCLGCRILPVICGDGIVTPRCSERCDDGNVTAGDGCSQFCQMEDAALACQTAISKAGGKYFKHSLKAVARCRNAINRGTLTIAPEECPTDTSVAPKLAKIGIKERDKLIKKCTDGVVAALKACAGTIDGLIGVSGGAGCIIDGARDATERLVAAAYGRVLDPSEKDLGVCQRAIAKSSTRYVMAHVRYRQECLERQNENGLYDDCIPGIDSGGDMRDDYTKFQSGVGKDCANVALAAMATCYDLPVTTYPGEGIDALTGTEAGCLTKVTSQLADELAQDWTGR